MFSLCSKLRRSLLPLASASQYPFQCLESLPLANIQQVKSLLGPSLCWLAPLSWALAWTIHMLEIPNGKNWVREYEWQVMKWSCKVSNACGMRQLQLNFRLYDPLQGLLQHCSNHYLDCLHNEASHYVQAVMVNVAHLNSENSGMLTRYPGSPKNLPVDDEYISHQSNWTRNLWHRIMSRSGVHAKLRWVELSRIPTVSWIDYLQGLDIINPYVIEESTATSTKKEKHQAKREAFLQRMKSISLLSSQLHWPSYARCGPSAAILLQIS